MQATQKIVPHPIMTEQESDPPLFSKADEQLSRKAFSVLARDHHRMLIVYANALCKDEHRSRDIVQEAFVVAWKNLHTFDVTRDFSAWMRGIVRNKWREEARRNARQVSVDDETLEFLEADTREFDQIRDEGGVFAKLEGCIKKLPDNLARAVTAYYYEERSGEDAASVLDVEASALRKRLQRARESLRLCIQKPSPQI